MTRWWVAVACLVGVALAGPEWVPRAWSREDGPIEWLGFGAFAVGAALAFTTAWQSRASRATAAAVAVLGLVLLGAAGEEISWGQRLLDVSTPEVLVDGNRQDELNFHNVEGIQDKAIIAQLGLAAAGAALPWVVGSRWARAGFPFFVGYLSFRAARAVVALAAGAPSGDNSEGAEVLLAAGLLSLTVALHREIGRSRRSGAGVMSLPRWHRRHVAGPLAPPGPL